MTTKTLRKLLVGKILSRIQLKNIVFSLLDIIIITVGECTPNIKHPVECYRARKRYSRWFRSRNTILFYLRVLGRIVVTVIVRGPSDYRQFPELRIITVVFWTDSSSVDFVHWYASVMKKI